MASAKESSERIDFSARLQEALKNSQHSSDSPTELSRDFNARFGGSPITVHAARKWLVGEAIPTQDKMRTLSQWLGVPIEWLRFGGDKRAATSSDTTLQLSPSDVKLIADFQLLDDTHQQMVREFIRIMVRVNRQKNRSGDADALSQANSLLD